MIKGLKILINRRYINRINHILANLIHPKLKSRLNISKAAVVLIAMGLTAVTLSSNVSAANADTGDVFPVFQQTGSNAPDSRPGNNSAAVQTPPLDYFTDNAEVETTVLSMLVQAEEANADISVFLNLAAEQIGKPYVFGRTGPKSFDCSGLVYYCLNKAGLSVDRTTASGFSKEKDWEKITSMDDLKPGDLLFFSTGGKKVGHTGIYIGDGKMIDASSSNREVVQRSCVTSYWTNHFVFARRPF
ncbi:MAG: C40 family peptidase [Eubacteriales bacterium]